MKKLFLFALISSCCSFQASAQVYKESKEIKTPEEKLNEEYCSSLFKNYDGIIFDLANDNQSAEGYLNILDWLNGRVAGLQIFSLRNGILLPVIRNSRASIYVDEILEDPDYLNLLPVSDIAMIKVIKEPFAGNWGNASGAIAIYTKQGDDDEDDE